MRDSAAAEKLDAALARLANDHYGAFLTGIERYRASGFARDAVAPPAIFTKGTTRLLDFSAPGAGPAVLVIPSLINRYHVLDIDHGQSFMRDLAGRGYRACLIDWGVPGPEESAFSLDDYFAQRLLPILDFLHEKTGQPVHIAGYCMGGLMATALAQLWPHAVKSLMCLATPWDFHADDPALPERVKIMLAALEPFLDSWGHMPVDMLQGFFVTLQPFMVHDKFVRFSHTGIGSAEERAFVLVEDWINDGVPLVKEVARACLQEWYIDNLPVQNRWRVMGQNIIPHMLTIPAMHVIPQRDRIVPPKSAMALAAAMPDAVTLTPAFGHISMMVHAAARDNLWPRLFDWLASKA